jgi:Taurine catabolism dioxygenase TauD, TfdA family
MADLATLATEANRKGWASGSGDVGSIRKQAAALGWAEVAPRRGDATVSVLRPSAASNAHPNSLSATYGLGRQPLHTDGAHMQEPPDLLVLICTLPSATSTQLWRPDFRQSPPASTTTAFSHGMFLVRNGRESFYAPALSGSWALSGARYRYDPGCMTPCDARAREVQEYFEQQLSRAVANEWQTAGQVLVIDNRRVLHARSGVADGDLNRELTRIAFRMGQAR